VTSSSCSIADQTTERLGAAHIHFIIISFAYLPQGLTKPAPQPSCACSCNSPGFFFPSSLVLRPFSERGGGNTRGGGGSASGSLCLCQGEQWAAATHAATASSWKDATSGEASRLGQSLISDTDPGGCCLLVLHRAKIKKSNTAN